MPVTNLAPEIQSFDEVFSVGRMKQMMITRKTGDEIAQVDFENNPMNIFCIEDGVSYKKGHLYLIDNDGVMHDVFLTHDHSSSDKGGTYYDIKKGNYNQLIEMDYSLNIMKAFFHSTNNGTGTDVGVTDQVDELNNQKYVQLLTGTTLDNYANIVAGGGRIFFGKPITMQVKYTLSSNIDVTYRMGMNNPLIQNSVTNSVVQLGFTACSGTNANNGVFSSDGTLFSVDYMSAMVQPNAFGLRLDWYPSSKIDARDGNGVQALKTSNMPNITAATTSNATFRAGVRVTAGGSGKSLRIFALRLLGHSYDSQSGIKAWV